MSVTIARAARAEGPEFLIPPGARDEWAALSRALLGVVPSCASSTVPQTWWEPARAEDAKAACWACVARSECLGYAVAAGERYGVWGAMSPAERAVLRPVAAS